MKKRIPIPALALALAPAFAPALDGTLYGQTLFTHNTNQNVWASNSAACTTSGPGTIHNNNFIRVFNTTEFNVQDTVFFVAIELGVESTSGGAYDLIGRVHDLAGAPLFGNMTLLAVDTAAVYPDSVVYRMKIPLDSGYTVPGDSIVTEVFAPINAAVTFYPGSNPYPETDTSYIAAPGCGIAEPTPYSTIGFASVKLILNLWVNHKPAMGNMAVSVFKDNVFDFAKTDFDAAFNDFDSDTINMLKLVTVPANGTIDIGSGALSAGDTIYSDELDALVYTPGPGFSGNDDFTFLVRDNSHWSNNPASVNITVFDWQASIQELDLYDLHLYPNPASDMLYIETTGAVLAVRLYDENGRCLKSYLAGTGGIQLNDLASGNYFIAVLTENGWSVKKIIKE
jgi:hypothetical protein